MSFYKEVYLSVSKSNISLIYVSFKIKLSESLGYIDVEGKRKCHDNKFNILASQYYFYSNLKLLFLITN